jgi:hypothetical protein
MAAINSSFDVAGIGSDAALGAASGVVATALGLSRSRLATANLQVAAIKDLASAFVSTFYQLAAFALWAIHGLALR